MVADEERLETPKQLAARVGVKERHIRHLINTLQIEHAWIGSRAHIPIGAFARFLETNKVKPCHDETKARACVTSKNVNASTSHGQNAVAAASAQLARATANKLKSTSQSGCKSKAAEAAQVIPLQSS